jgi:hypothetical protein
MSYTYYDLYMKINLKNNQSGVAALLVILVVGAATLALAGGAAIVSMSEVDMSYTNNKSEEALVLAEGCLEDSIRRVQLGNVIEESFTLPLSRGFCIISITDVSDSAHIEVEANIDNYSKKVWVQLEKTESGLNLTKWLEKS